MRLDVILPTFNRHDLLKLTLESLLAADVPPDLGVSVMVVDNGSQHVYGTSDAELMGGNAVISRAMLMKVGLYSTDLGRNGKRPLADEDTDMYHRLLAAGARGMYVPDLIIYHYIHPNRLTKRYFRRWHFWRGVSSGRLDQRQPQPTPYLFGVPRYLFGSAARGFLR